MFSKNFLKKYKPPFYDGTKNLYRFSAFIPETINHHRALFIDKQLFHNQPSNFNDPFDCRFVLKWPETPKEKNAFKEDLISLQIIKGEDMKRAVLNANSIRSYGPIFDELKIALVEKFQRFRICCFTNKKENLLFWSHYADSHKGYCVEYSTNGPVLAQVYRVRYTKKFPSLKFPVCGDVRKSYLKAQDIANHNQKDNLTLDLDGKMIEPILMKSKEWDYEEEYRSIYVPEAPLQLPSYNDTSLLLNGDEITNVYFGCKMPAENRQQLIAIIKQGPFNPKLWQAEIAPDKFALKFKPIE